MSSIKAHAFLHAHTPEYRRSLYDIFACKALHQARACLRHAADARGHDEQPGSGRLHERYAEGLRQRRVQEHAPARKHARHLRDMAGRLRTNPGVIACLARRDARCVLN